MNVSQPLIISLGKLRLLTEVSFAMTSQKLALAISELYARTITTGKITDSHRQILKEAICSPGLAEEERTAIDRLLWATVRGRLVIVDE